MFPDTISVELSHFAFQFEKKLQICLIHKCGYYVFLLWKFQTNADCITYRSLHLFISYLHYISVECPVSKCDTLSKKKKKKKKKKNFNSRTVILHFTLIFSNSN